MAVTPWGWGVHVAKSSDKLSMSAPASLLTHLLPDLGPGVTQGPATTAMAQLQGCSSTQPRM